MTNFSGAKMWRVVFGQNAARHDRCRAVKRKDTSTEVGAPPQKEKRNRKEIEEEIKLKMEKIFAAYRLFRLRASVYNCGTQ